jgi:murein DD-endopeptidase MepM/ murein hydrolase activator NlpD
MHKKKNFYTIMFIPEGNARTFSMHIHRNIVYSLLVFLVVFFVGFILLVVKSGEIAAKLQLVYLLTGENRQLREENKTMKSIAVKIDGIEQMSRYLQRIATATNTDPKKGLLAFSKTASGSEAVFAKDNMDELLDNMRKASGGEAKTAARRLEATELYIASVPNIQPVVDGWITRRFSMTGTDTSAAHTGIDYAATLGTLIRATAPGVVEDVSNDKYFGLTLMIKHGYGYSTKYGHCSQILVAKGDHVERGQTIALVGNTGRSSAPHLHYEVLKDGKNVDPTNFVFGGSTKTD